MIALTSQPRRRESILRQRAADTMLLLNREGGQYYALDEVGSRAWELLDGTRSVAAVASLLGEEYEAPAATIEADLIELLEDLAREKLLDVES
jgi:hypothetical protein